MPSLYLLSSWLPDSVRLWPAARGRHRMRPPALSLRSSFRVVFLAIVRVLSLVTS